MKDDFYYRYLQKNDALGPVFAVLAKFETRNNMVNSAIIDMLEFIRMENVKDLVQYIVDKYARLRIPCLSGFPHA